MNNYVYVITKAKPLEAERYVSVKGSFKDAEKYIRKYYPNARKDDHNPDYVNFLCKGDFDLACTGIPTNCREDFLLFIRKESL